MKCHANQDNLNFPCPGVYSTSIMEITSLVRILHSNASIHNTLLITSVFAPTLFPSPLTNGLLQHCKESLHFGNMKAQHQNAVEQKKIQQALVYTMWLNSRTLKLVLSHWQYLKSWPIKVQLLITGRPCGKEAAPSLACPF